MRSDGNWSPPNALNCTISQVVRYGLASSPWSCIPGGPTATTVSLFLSNFSDNRYRGVPRYPSGRRDATIPRVSNCPTASRDPSGESTRSSALCGIAANKTIFNQSSIISM